MLINIAEYKWPKCRGQMLTFYINLVQDPVSFFKWFFTQQKGWGLTMYEQDWMCTEYDGVDALQGQTALLQIS